MADSFEDLLAQRGAIIAPFFGQPLPASFGHAQNEWRAAREGCGVFDAGFRSFVCVTGSDRVAFLQGMLSNDVKRLAAGHGMHAGFLTQQAKLVSDLRVYADDQSLILDALRWRVDTLTEGLERFLIADDVELERSPNEVPLIGLEGPLAGSIVRKLFDDGAAGGAPYRHERVIFEGSEVRVVEVSEVGGSGFLLCGKQVSAAPLFEALCKAGACPIGMDALNVLRVERGIPWAGIDMDENVLLMEVGLDDAVSFNKGCYLGQEVVERVSARGHVNRKLSGLVLESVHLPATGCTVLHDGTDVGWTVSAVESFAVGRPIALAYLRREVLEPGTRVQVSNEGTLLDATVQTLPFPGAVL